MTDQQLSAILGMEDLTTDEKRLARQQALTQQLRTNALQPSTGKDWASQLSRGLQGIGAAYGMRQGDQMLGDFAGKKQRTLETLRSGLMQPQPRTISPEELGDVGGY